MAGAIHVGIGGWDFDPWRGTFYPEGLARTKQLEHLATRLNATEVNATYYSTMSPSTFVKWRDSVPDGFVFALKASRFCTNRKNLGEVGESIEKFCAQGFTELGDKLGPILWQLAPTKKFDADEIGAFLKLLPEKPRRAEASPCAGAEARELQIAGLRRSGPRGRCRDRLRRPRNLSRDRRSHRRFRLCAAAAGEGGGSRRLFARRHWTAGQKWPKAGRKGRARPGSIMYREAQAK